MKKFIRSIIAAIILLSALPSITSRAFAACEQGTTMNVVAHQDDDLLFLNPDIQNDISSGRCVITVYTTAGDADLDSNYWIGRENGEKQAYSLMNSTLNFWTQQDAGIVGHSIPVFTLSGAPSTTLAFIRLPDGNYTGSGFPTTNNESLQKLWQGTISSMTTVDGTSTYTKQDLINTLVDLMNTYQPDIIRTQNFVDGYNSAVDHSDHYSTAYVTKAASQLYTSSHILISYYDYEINTQPQNIFGTNATAKTDTFISYAQYDPLVCQTVETCNAKYLGWFVRQYIAETITPTLTPTPTISGSPTPSATATPSPTPSPTPVPLTNIAPLGIGYRWSQMTSATASAQQVAAIGVNDGIATVDIALTGGPDDSANAYEGAGVIFSTPQDGITSVEYVNGIWDSALNGAFTANIQLQISLDGNSWISSGLSPTPAYNYDSSSSSGKTYTFTGVLPSSIKGIRVVGQVRTRNSLSWHAYVREVRILSSGISVSPTPSPTVSPTPTVTPTPTGIVTPSPTPNPSVTPTPTPTTQTNIAPSGTGYRWSQMTTSLVTTNQTQSMGINDSNLSVDVALNGGPDDKANAYEGAGVIFTDPQVGISKVEYINGSWDSALNGAFTANLQLQTSTDGVTWVNSGFTPTPAYNYDSSSSSGKTYIFTGAFPSGIRGIRIVGQVRTFNALSWHANTREVRIYSGVVSETPSPTPSMSPTPTLTPTPTPVMTVTLSPTPTTIITPSPTPTIPITPTPTPIITGTPTVTPSPTPIPSGSVELLSSLWTLAASSGSAEKDISIPSSSLIGKTSAIVRFDTHGSSFGSGDDEASLIFIQSGVWYGVNIIARGINGTNGVQTITIPLSAFRKVGSSSPFLDLTKTVTNLHARFWKSSAYSVDIISVQIQ